MIQGFGGELISHAFVEHELLPAAGRDDDVAAFERRLGQWWRRVDRLIGPASGTRLVHDVAVVPLLQLLGHAGVASAPHAPGLCGEIPGSQVVCMTVPWSMPVRGCWRAGVAAGVAARRRWVLVCNGHSLRIIDSNRAWTRKGVEFDLAAAASSSALAALLWQLAHANAFAPSNAHSLHSIVERSDAHAARVCASLGDGVLAALPHLASALAHRSPRPALDQALTVVYRILFLLFAEAHGMVPLWHEIYREAYSIDVLTRNAMCGQMRGLWPALRAISRLAHAGCRAGDLDVTAFNGRLFSPRHAPLVEQRRLPDATAAEVLLAIATERTRSGRRRISYFDLGVEQLGSVYERVLEYEPVPSGKTLRLAKTSTERKSTGSFYTPRSITEYLVRRTLAPLTEHKRADEILQLRIVDPAMGSGAFLVAACRYLADQCEQAYVREGKWFANEIRDADRAGVRRLISERCLFGVDLNPTAVQLARLSLWLTTLAGDRPLTFLDHHLATGNSLIGARLADLSRPIRNGRSSRDIPLPLLEDQLSEVVARHILPSRIRLATIPSDSVEQVHTKERLLAELATAHGPIAKWLAAADAWSAAALAAESRPSPGMLAELITAATGGTTTLPAAQVRASLDAAKRVAAEHGAFHWELTFPEVFFDATGRPGADGGFDAVIGNPPWDMVRADTGTTSDRAATRSATAAAMRFFRDSGIYRLQGSGHANRYQFFLERALQLVRAGGRIGLILPSGIATDHGSATLRHHLFDRTTIDTWLGFDNRTRIFPIHRSMRFVVLTAANTGSTPALNFATGLVDPQVLDADQAGDMLSVSRSRLESWSSDLAIPEIRDRTALAIVTSIANRCPALGDAGGWQAKFGRELNATDDRPHFVTNDRRHGNVVPIVEGKLLSPFQIDLARASAAIPLSAAGRLAGSAALKRARIAYRDVASATNKLTLIAALLPAGAISTHTVFVLKTPLAERDQWCLLGLLNSFVANFLVRARVTTHVTTGLMARLPVPRPVAQSSLFDELVELSQEIAAIGVGQAATQYARLNAVAARAYGLDGAQFAYVIDTFPLIDSGVRARAREEFALLDRSVLPRLE